MNVKRALSLLVILVSTSPLFAADYVLQSGRWSKAQADAVAAAGGTVVYAHRTGIGVVSSDAPDFEANAVASGAFQSVAKDMVVQWQSPVTTVDLQQDAINPLDDTFYSRVQWAPQAVNAPAAWAAGLTGAGVRVAVLDGGIYNVHPDLAGNIDTARSRSFTTGAYNTDTGTFWHGTHVAGIIAARDNTTGVVGIAPEATIVGVKVLHNGSGSFGGIIAGILYASDPIEENGGGAHIINMSLGAVFERAGGAGTLIGAMAKALNYAASRGVLVVSSTGNDGADFGQLASYVAVPAESGNGLAVSATGPFGWAYGATDVRRPASYSNYGEGMVSVAGPGGDFAWPTNESCTVRGVTTACWVFDMVLSTSRAGYSWAAGTSMSSPAVAAVAALVKQAHPTASLGELKTRLLRSTDDEGPRGTDEFYGHGFVNAAKAAQ